MKRRILALLLCCNAVRWAYQNQVTAGATATEFAPRQTCTRAQVMTFLYKLFGAA